MSLNQQWLKQALEITGDFETSGNPWSQITGDFDGQGISCGVLQWNIGQGSLQPLIKAVGQNILLHYMPQYGSDLWSACTTSIPSGLQIVRSWQYSGRVKSDISKELKALFESPEMIQQQISHAANLGERADDLAILWAKDQRNAQSASLHDFCWFFDLLVMNGGMKNIWYNDVKRFITAYSPDKADDVICDWLKAASPQMYRWRDSHKNAGLWRNNVKADIFDLFVLGYLRAQKSRSEYRVLVMNRRGTIAMKRGYVNGELENFNI